MTGQATSSRIARRLTGITGVAVVLTVAVACGGGSDTAAPTTTATTVPVTETTALVKNRPLNNCVSVMSGERPRPGVTIPRCVPTTTANK